MGSAPSALSMVRATSARPGGGGPDVPAKMTSSILPPRSDFAPCSPITQASASTTLDLPEPFGPTMQVIPGSSASVVDEANDLNPRSVRLFRYTYEAPRCWSPSRECCGEGQAAHYRPVPTASRSLAARRVARWPGAPSGRFPPDGPLDL